MGFGVVCVLYADFSNALQPIPAWMPGYGLVDGTWAVVLTLIYQRSVVGMFQGIAATIGISVDPHLIAERT
jgi:hypothetical protein